MYSFFNISNASVSLETQGLARYLQRERERALTGHTNKERVQSSDTQCVAFLCVHTSTREYIPCPYIIAIVLYMPCCGFLYPALSAGYCHRSITF